MRFSHFALVRLLPILILLGPLSLFATTDSLWQKAVDLTAGQNHQMPGKIVMESRVKTMSGKVKDKTHIVMETKVDEHGEVITHTVLALENGQDVTARVQMEEHKAQEKQGKETGDGETFSMDLSSGGLFKPENQAEVILHPRNGTRMVKGRVCRVYDFRLKVHGNGEGVEVGTAWLEESSGRPVKVIFTVEPLPKHVKALKTTVHYGPASNGRWVPLSMGSKGVGGILFLKRRFEMEMRMSDWKEIPRVSDRGETQGRNP